MLLSSGAERSATNEQGITPLHTAASINSGALFLLLEDNKAPLNAMDANGNTPLHAACLANNLESVRHLLSAGALVDISDKTKTTPLMSATQLGFNEIALYLIGFGASLEPCDIRGNSVLHWAAASNNAQMVKECLTRSPKRNEINLKSETPLLLAAREGHGEVVKLLWLEKADPFIEDVFGRTFFDVAKTEEVKSLIPEPSGSRKRAFESDEEEVETIPLSGL